MPRIYKSGKDIPTYVHGKYGTRVYFIWNGILTRCLNKKATMYSSYGGRGIKVCAKWRNFVGFYEDMGEPPTNKHSIDRIDNSKGYNKSNCRWSTSKEQARNRKTNRFIVVGSDRKTLAEWGEISGIHPDTISNRLRRGWPAEKAVSIKPVRGRNQTFSLY